MLLSQTRILDTIREECQNIGSRLQQLLPFLVVTDTTSGQRQCPSVAEVNEEVEEEGGLHAGDIGWCL